MTDARTAELLDRLLRPRLGYGTPPSEARMRARLGQLARELGTDTSGVLHRALGRAAPSGLIDRIVQAATIPHTTFFRHPEQLAELERHLRVLATRRGGPVRIWCAGCATGEEVYSVAMIAERAGVRAEILGTDASADAIDSARRGVYPARRSGGVPSADPVHGWTAPEPLRARVRFERASLVEPRPAAGAGPFDVVMCRNVLIYFERARAMEVLGVLAAHAARDAVIVVAPVEALVPPPDGLEPAGPVGWLRHVPKKGIAS